MFEIIHGTQETIVYDKNLSIRPYHNREACSYPNHWQPSYEIIMPLESSYTVHVEQHKLELNPNDILFIAPSILHSIDSPASGDRYILLFDPHMFHNISEFENLSTSFYPYCLFTAENTPVLTEMNECMNKIYLEYQEPDYYRYGSIFSYLLRLLVLAKRNQTDNLLVVSDITNYHAKYISKFKDICQYIEDNCTEEIDLDQLAKMSGFSNSHFMRLFKQITNMTYYSYINQCRINHAKQLLSNQVDYSITEISLKSGFSSITTFNRVFKQHFHCSPSQYRNMQDHN